MRHYLVIALALASFGCGRANDGGGLDVAPGGAVGHVGGGGSTSTTGGFPQQQGGSSGSNALTCADGTYADGGGCVPWTKCPMFFAESVAGTSTHDRQCKERGWVRQQSTSGLGGVVGLSETPSGLLTVGATLGALPGQASSGLADAYALLYSPIGDVLWGRQFGGSNQDEAAAVGVAGGSVFADIYVAGRTYGTLANQVSAGDIDAFVRKYNNAGEEVWTRQFGTEYGDHALAVKPDGVRNVYVVGTTDGTLPGWTRPLYEGKPIDSASATFVRKYDAAGAEVWTRQFMGSPSAFANSLAVESNNGTAYVGGNSIGCTPPQPGMLPPGGFVVKYDDAGTLVWQHELPGFVVQAIALDGFSNVFVQGTDSLAKLNPSGVEIWKRDLNLGRMAQGTALSVGARGVALVAGWVDGALPGHTSAGGRDAFVAMYDADGLQVWTNQFGTSGDDKATAIVFGGISPSDVDPAYVAGVTDGVFPDQSDLTLKNGIASGFLKVIVP